MRGPPAASTMRTNGRSGSTGAGAGVDDWAARKRRIGQRGSQTEMMRGMIELHYPLARSAVAATLEPHLPAPARDQAEAVERGGCGGDAPACHRDARHAGRPQQQQEAACCSGGEVQSLARSEIELPNHARDGRRRSRVERFFHGPERLRGVLGLDQNHAGGIKTEAIEAMAIAAPECREAAGRGDKKDRGAAWVYGAYPAQHCCHEAE